MATKPRDFSPPQRIDLDFFRSLNKTFKQLGISPEQTPANVLRAFANLSTNVDVLEDIAKRLAARMVTQVRASNARSWRAAASESSKGRVIFEALQRELRMGLGNRVTELVEQNAKLITSIPGKVREEVNNEIAAMEQEGLRPETIAEHLRKRIPQLTRHRAALIARTEVGKASMAITRARSENLGIDWYQWQTSRDSRVRPAHKLLQSVLVRWDDPPSPEALDGIRSTLGHYNAGNAPNCRCDTYPIISLDTISWPARVYTNGAIQRMTRGQFAEFSGMRRRVAA